MVGVLEFVCEYHDFRIQKDVTRGYYCICTKFKIVYNYFHTVEDAMNFIKEIYKNPVKYLKDLIK